MLRDDNTTIVVKNALGNPSPNTGGSGTNLIYIPGIMLIVLAGAGIALRRLRNL